MLNKNINQDWLLIPTLKIVNKVDNKTYAFSRSLAFEKKSNLLEIETIAKMLVSSSLEQMKKNGIQFVIGDKQFVDKKENDKTKDKIKEEIKLLLYNNKNLVEKITT